MTTQVLSGGRRYRGYMVALVISIVLFFVVGLDQGQTLSLFQGEIAYAQNLIHETVHDARHAAGMPCH